MPSFLMG